MRLLSIILTFCFLISSCTHTGMGRRNLEQYFVSSGVTRYFLPDLPQWANFSQGAACFRSSSLRYFDMKKLRKSFFLTYEQASHFQLMFNVEKKKQMENSSLDSLPLNEEEKVFYNVSEKVQSGALLNRLPIFIRVNLIWVDPFVSGEEGMDKLNALLDSQDMNDGHPVFVSLCQSYTELEKFMRKHGYVYRNIKMISYEMFSLYDEKMQRRPNFFIDFNHLFKKEQKLYMYSSKKKYPSEFQGKFHVKYF